MTGWVDGETLALLADGLAVTVVVTVITGVLAFVVGIAIGTARLSESRALSVCGSTFVEVFRNIPALIQIIFWGFAFPSVFPEETRRIVFFDNQLWDLLGAMSGIPIPYYAVAACVGLVMNTGAHLAELFRAGARAIPSAQLEAARSLGADRREVYWAILVPGALRVAFPAITTRLVHNLKNTALVSFVAVPDLFHAMQAAINESFRASQLLALTAAMYLALSLGLAALLGRVDVWLHRGRETRVAA